MKWFWLTGGLVVAANAAALLVTEIDQKNRVYIDYFDELKWDYPPVAAVFGWPCPKRFSDGEIYYDDGPSCRRYDPPRRFKGYWDSAYEGSTFYPDEKSLLAMIENGPELSVEQAWLSVPDEWDDRNGPTNFEYDAVYEIEFIGRHSSAPAEYGHMNAWRHQILVDKLISMKKIAGGNEPSDD